MKANTFEIMRFTKEIKYKEREDIKLGCCLCDENPTPIAKFNTYEEAIEELKKDKYKPSCNYTKGFVYDFFQVTEYAVECYEADEDGEFLSGSDYDMAWNYEFDNETKEIKINKC